MDSNGRILLPLLLREYAGIDKQVILVGQGKKFELWSKAAWQIHREQWLNPNNKGKNAPPPELESISL